MDRVGLAGIVAWSMAAAVAVAQESLAEKSERIAFTAWRAARALVAVGGSLDQLGPVGGQLAELELLRAEAARVASVDGARLTLSLRYADAAVRAAIAAAQDEREEMSVFLKHARALDAQLAGIGPPASWPLPIDELDGDLWLEVDRYAEARDAYLRAIATGGGARAWIGLARAQDRLDNRLAACDAYRRASTGSATEDEKTEALHYLNSAACQ